jgi:hypothetical protein
MSLIQLIRSWIPATLFICLGFLFCCSDDSVEPPKLEADAGANQNTKIGQKVTLNGNGSSDPNSNSFDFSWRFTEKPPGSTASLANHTTATPDFAPDVGGKYKVELTVSNSSTDLDTVTISAFKVVNITGTYDNLVPGSDVGIRKFRTALNNLYATCEFNEIGGVEAKKIACFNGSNWTALGCGLTDGSIYDMIAYKDELYVTGQFDEIGCVPANNIARWTGSEWEPLGNGLTGGDNPFGYALAVYNDELYVGGQFTLAGNITVSNIAKWDGTQWTTAGSFKEGSVRVLQVYKGKLYAGGFFTVVDGANVKYVASTSGGTWTGLGSTAGLELKSTGVVRHMAVFGELLYMSGDFTASNNDDISELITWNGSTFDDFGTPFSMSPGNTIRTLKAIKNTLYIGGEFTNVVGAQAKNVLQWDGDSWGIMGTGVSGIVLSIEGYNDKVYIGGEFTTAGGSSAENISLWEEG